MEEWAGRVQQQEQEAVATTIKGYLNDLLSLGVAGFRIDAAKDMGPCSNC